jgi:hypothetical protein
MKNTLALLLSTTALCLIAQGANAWTHGGGGSASCPYTGDPANDGCSGAPVAGIVQHPTFFNGYAQGNGQTYTTRPNWNVAGVDFGVAYPAATVLQDALNAGGTASAIPGCSYDATNVRLICSTTNQIIDGYDFSLHGCTKLLYNNPTSTSFTVRNSKFGSGPGCESGGGYLVGNNNSTTATTNLIIQNSLFDQNAGVGTPSLTNMVTWGGHGTVDITYSAFLNGGARDISPNSDSNISYKYNYIEGLWGNTNHAEFAITNTNNGTMALHTIGFNTFYQPATVLNPSVTALNSITEVPTARFTTVNGTGNTLVSNKQTRSFTISLGGIPAAGDTITFTPTGGGGATTVTFVASGATGNQVNIGGTMAITTANLLAFLQGSADANISRYTYVASPTNVASDVYARGAANVNSTMTMSEASSNISISYASVGYLNVVAYGTFGTINWTKNYMDSSGAFGCFARESSPTVGAENFSGNINLLDGSTVATGNLSDCHGHM